MEYSITDCLALAFLASPFIMAFVAMAFEAYMTWKSDL